MAVKEKTVKERLLDLVETMNETQLLELEKLLDDLAKKERMERQLEALRNIAGIITDPEEIAALEQATQRRPFFGNRELDLEP
ncbi:hypothetical protein BH24DEI2_BH24DEI2_16720 [soil metagenome]